MTILAALSDNLSEIESDLLRPVLAIDPARIDPQRARLVVRTADVLVCEFVATDDRSCPFTVALGRGSHLGRIGFYIGAGADVVDWEEHADPGEFARIRALFTEFLASSVKCERVRAGSDIEKERYHVSIWTERISMPFVYSFRWSWPWLSRTVETIVYQPWCVVTKAKVEP